MVASQRRPASLAPLAPGAAGGTPGANPKASMTSPLSARHNQVRRATSGCGVSSVKAPPASGRPSAMRWAPSSAKNRLAPALSAAASTSQDSVDESSIARSWGDAPLLSRPIPQDARQCVDRGTGEIASGSRRAGDHAGGPAGDRAFFIAGLLTLAALAAIREYIFSYIMTKSAIFAIYSVFALAVLLAWKTGQTRHFVLAGALLGLLCLTKPSFVILSPLIVALILLCGHRSSKDRQPSRARCLLGFSLAFAIVLGPWTVRNAISVEKFGLTEEYGAAALIERFAYDDMTPQEFLQAFPYCVPGLGDLVFDRIYGTDSMHRFVFHTPHSFFHVGPERRDSLVREHGRLDPIIGSIALDEMRARW